MTDPLADLTENGVSIWLVPQQLGGGVPKRAFPLTSRERFPCACTVGGDLGETGSSTAVPCVLLTRKGSQVQTLSRPPGPTHLSVRRSGPLVSRLSADHFS